MDSIKGVERPWIHNAKIKVRSFLDVWKSQDLSLETDLTLETLDEQFTKMFNVDQEMIDSLKEDLSPDCLTNDTDKGWKDCVYGNKFSVPDHVKLVSVAAQVKHTEKMEVNRKYRSCASQLSKYRNYTFLDTSEIKKRPNDEQKVTDLDVVLNVQIFEPMKFSLYVGEHRKHVNPIANQEFLCLGSQFLTALRDEIICPVDASPIEDCSDDPKKSKPIAGEIYTSGFFFIDDCFYNDFRKTSNIDYSQVIIDWAKKSDRKIGELQTAKMETSCFNDLTIRLGQPYVYVHQGNCEHMIVFSEIRLFSPQTDSPFIDDYPRLFKTYNRPPIMCYMCKIIVSKWIVFENKRLPDNPWLFCEQCFNSFNYDSQKKKVGHFKAFAYLDKSAII